MTTGTGTIVGVRMLDHPLAAVDAWIAKQKESDLSRPEAIRRLVEIGLKSETLSKPIAKPGRRSRAQELARNAIEKIIDPATSPEERAQRRQRLSKGPPEFREDRVDQPKAKR
ncbi:MAG: hypothetical protein JWN43_4831 [Gammaproteobacteria bacterium]|nr:hypothetical protein [Gammaproteobacteria bacterium]